MLGRAAMIVEMIRIITLVACVALAGCGDDAVTCEDGRTCEAGFVCDDVHALCVTPAQLAACVALADGSPCTSSTLLGVCQDMVCLELRCGDGFVHGSEQCDGANLGNAQDCVELGFYNSGPISCTSLCTIDTSACTGFCGDGVVDGPEVCDGNATTCQALGFANGGAVPCKVGCTFDTSGCST
jgi:hypothetical protein